MITVPRHKVFISYHHYNDEHYKKLFCKLLGLDYVDRSVEDGDIDPYLAIDTVRQKIRDNFIADATVTVVLVGSCTWQRKHVDWEIGSSLRDTRLNSRCGLLGILLPTHHDFGKTNYSLRRIPPRLADNCGSQGKFGKIYNWHKPWSAEKVRSWIHDAFERRNLHYPNNSRDQFINNRSSDCIKGW